MTGMAECEREFDCLCRELGGYSAIHRVADLIEQESGVSAHLLTTGYSERAKQVAKTLRAVAHGLIVARGEA
jgi:hypothetical protein